MHRLMLGALLLLPFNALPIYFFGSISSEGAFYPLLILVAFVFAKVLITQRFKVIDKTIIGIMLLIISFSIVSFLANLNMIAEASHMGRFGVIRFTEQLFQLSLGFIITYSVAYTINSERQLYQVVKFLVIVMAAYVIFGFFQFAAYNFGGGLNSLHAVLGKVFFHSGIPESMSERGRIHSVSQEPSLLSMYIAVISPYIIGYSIKTKRYYHVVFMTLLLLMSFSRTGYVVYVLLAIILFMLFKFGYLNTSKFIYTIPAIVLFLAILLATPMVGIFTSLIDVGENGSNAARYAGVFSAILLWWDNNIWLGIGLGQTGFHSTNYLPAWGFISGEIQDIANGERWPFIHNLLVKILVENGLIGLFLWLSLFVAVLIKINRINYKNFTQNKPNRWLGYSAFASIAACLLIMFNRELLSNMNIWISLGLALAFIKLSANKPPPFVLVKKLN